MCGELIQASNSCYLDDFSKIFEILSLAFVFGGFIGSMVGIIKVFLKKS